MSRTCKHQDVLAWVNRIRDEYVIGPALDKLPQGVPMECSNCPIAVALKATTGGSVSLMKPGNQVQHPDYVVRFIDDFDCGVYPELIA